MIAPTLLEPTFDRQPPYAPEAEISVIGAMLMDAEAVDKAIAIVDESMFYREANRRVFRAMNRLFLRGQVVDPTSLREDLQQVGDLDAVGGMEYLSELLDAVPTAANIEYHARIVRDRYMLRRLIEESSAAIRDAYDPGERTVTEILDGAQQRLFQVVQSHDRGAGLVWAKQRLYGVFEKLEAGARPGAPDFGGVPTGYYDVDELTNGLKPANLILVAARPSMGKSSFAFGAAMHIAINHQIPVAIFSVEMSTEEVLQRMLCAEALVDLKLMSRPKLLKDDDFVRLAQAAGHMNTAPLYIDETGGLTVMEMRAKARRLKAEHPELGLLIVDHIHIMHGDGRRKNENREQEVSQIGAGLKELAKELDIPVMALGQLSRAPEQRSDHRPQLSDLRDSGTLEQNADVVMFLYRPEYYLTPKEAAEQGMAGKAELIIGKQRNGPTGSVELFFRRECARYESFTHKPEIYG